MRPQQPGGGHREPSIIPETYYTRRKRSKIPEHLGEIGQENMTQTACPAGVRLVCMYVLCGREVHVSRHGPYRILNGMSQSSYALFEPTEALHSSPIWLKACDELLWPMVPSPPCC